MEEKIICCEECKFEENCPVYPGRIGLCGAGTFMAGTQSQQYVSCRGRLFSAAGQLKKAGSAAAVASDCRLRRDHRGGTAGRSLVQPGLPGLGLPESAVAI